MENEIILISTKVEKDKYNQSYPKETDRVRVFADKQSIGRDEFYKAGQQGMAASCVFKIWKYDYSNEQYLLYGDTTYHIYRTYENDDEQIELYCQETTDMEADNG